MTLPSWGMRPRPDFQFLRPNVEMTELLAQGNRHTDFQVEQRDLPGPGPADTGGLVVTELECVCSLLNGTLYV